MATTLKAIRRRMLEIERDLGRVENIASLTTTTCVVSALAVGSLSDQKFRNHWIVRADSTAIADRVRAVTSFTASSGTLTHAGTNYSDTTATSEVVEILAYEPYLFDRAINEAIQQLRRENRTILPTIQGAYEYWLTDLSWIEGPDDIKKVEFSTRPVISRNRYFEDWNGYDTSGNLTPDFWSAVGSGTLTRVSPVTSLPYDNWRNKYALQLVSSSGTFFARQIITLGGYGIASDSLAGSTVSLVGRVYDVDESGSNVRVGVASGGSFTWTDYHSGAAAIEELTYEYSIPSTATVLAVEISVADGGTAYADECYLAYGTLDDAMRRDAYTEHEVPWKIDQSGTTPKLILPVQSKGSQYIVTSTRGYPAFDATRLRSGAADADTTDAPELDAAIGALAILFEGLRGRRNEDTEKFITAAADYRRRFDRLLTGHQANNEPVVRKPAMVTGPRTMGRL